MQIEVFVILFAIPIALFVLGIKINFHPFGLISGLYLIFMGVLSYADNLSYKTGLVFSGDNQSIVTYTYTAFNETWINFLGIFLIGLGIILMYMEGKASWKAKFG